MAKAFQYFDDASGRAFGANRWAFAISIAIAAVAYAYAGLRMIGLLG